MGLLSFLSSRKGSSIEASDNGNTSTIKTKIYYDDQYVSEVDDNSSSAESSVLDTSAFDRAMASANLLQSLTIRTLSEVQMAEQETLSAKVNEKDELVERNRTSSLTARIEELNRMLSDENTTKYDDEESLAQSSRASGTATTASGSSKTSGTEEEDSYQSQSNTNDKGKEMEDDNYKATIQLTKNPTNFSTPATPNPAVMPRTTSSNSSRDPPGRLALLSPATLPISNRSGQLRLGGRFFKTGQEPPPSTVSLGRIGSNMTSTTSDSTNSNTSKSSLFRSKSTARTQLAAAAKGAAALRQVFAGRRRSKKTPPAMDEDSDVASQASSVSQRQYRKQTVSGIRDCVDKAMELRRSRERQQELERQEENFRALCEITKEEDMVKDENNFASLRTLSWVSSVVSKAMSIYTEGEDDAFTDRKGYFPDDDTLASIVLARQDTDVVAPSWNCGAAVACGSKTVLEEDEWDGAILDLASDDEDDSIVCGFEDEANEEDSIEGLAQSFSLDA